MPELPEVETVKNHLIKNVLNKKISKIIIFRESTVEGDINEFKKNIVGYKFTNIKRKGKYLIFELNNDYIMLSHLKLEGKYILGKNLKDYSPFVKVTFCFDDNTILNYDDSRCFGFVRVYKKDNYLVESKLNLLGPDANLDVDFKYFKIKANKDKRSIKEFLLDQNVIAGLGNIYVDETLFLSKIHPLSKTYLLTDSQLKEILKNAKYILNLAIKNNGSSVISFMIDRSIHGNMQDKLQAYGRKGKPCANCGHKMKKIFVNGRGTTFCPCCQRLYSNRVSIAILGPTGVGKSQVLKYFSDLKYKIFNSDDEVNNLYNESEFIKKLFKKFKAKTKEEVKKLISLNKINIKDLQMFIFPFVKEKILKFKKENINDNLALEIPLLFEANFDNLIDYTLFINSNKQEEHLKNREGNVKLQQNLNKKLNHRLDEENSIFTIINDGTKTELKNKIIKLDKFFKESLIKA